MNDQFNLWPSGSLRTSLVFVGASVCWGLYRDFDQQYTTQLQRTIDRYLGTYLNSWPVRHVHSDDWQIGDCRERGAFNAGDINHWGVGRPGLKIKSIDGIPAPKMTKTGTFHPFGGSHGEGYGAYRDPGININYAALRIYTPQIRPHWMDAPTWLFLGLSGSGWVSVYTGNGDLAKNIRVNSPNEITRYGVPLSASGHIDINANADVYVHYICPMGLQHPRHILTQVVARDSYCLQDYTAKVWEITHSIFNQDHGYASSPIYLIFDSYNSMVIAGNGIDEPDRRLTPEQYASMLGAFGSNLVASSPRGLQGHPRVILTNPVEPYGVEQRTDFGKGGGIAWLTGESSSTYDAALSRLAYANGWGYFDQNSQHWGANLTASDWEADLIHPNQPGADKIAVKLCNFFGLSAIG